MQGNSQGAALATSCSNKHCPQSLYIEGKLGINQLCPICHERYKNDFYCLYCHQVYFENTDDGKNWIECEQCYGWVHEECADVFISRGGQTGGNVSYKCIKCKKVESTVGASRRINVRNLPKVQKKNESGTFGTIGFQWALKPQEIAEDMLKVQQYLK